MNSIKDCSTAVTYHISLQYYTNCSTQPFIIMIIQYFPIIIQWILYYGKSVLGMQDFILHFNIFITFNEMPHVYKFQCYSKQ